MKKIQSVTLQLIATAVSGQLAILPVVAQENVTPNGVNDQRTNFILQRLCLQRE